MPPPVRRTASMARAASAPLRAARSASLRPCTVRHRRGRALGIPQATRAAPGVQWQSACAGDRPCAAPERPMLDVLMIAATVMFFAASVAFVNGCDRL